MAKDFTAIGHALAVPARSAIVSLLMDGSRRPASELADAAGVAASTASEHLGVLVDAGLLVCEPRGRRRFYRIAGGRIAGALEELGRLVPDVPVRSYLAHREAGDLASGRFCYDHLAGVLGVGVTDGLVARGLLVGEDLDLAPGAEVGFAELGISLADVASDAGRRRITRACADWTERRPHLAGALGAAVADHLVTTGWVRRRPGSRRGVEVTAAGRDGLGGHWGVTALG